MGLLEKKNILLGVSGGIAAYKAVEILRLFQKSGANVRVSMTKNATVFVGPLTFRAVSGHPVYLDVMEEGPHGGIRHIDLATWADGALVAPATANIIGKLANGIADDALSTLMLAVRAPLMICPAMNSAMYESRPVQRNLDFLEEGGAIILDADSGDLACGVTGPGRLPDPAFIVNRFAKIFAKKDMEGLRVLITAGPTVEAIDPVRYISNHSSGKMGYAIAKSAENRGASVTLVSGPVHLSPPEGVERIPVTSAEEMYNHVMAHMEEADIIIKVAAVADFRVANRASCKIKKMEGAPLIELEKNPDILETLGSKKKKQFLVGFAAETNLLAEYARDKIRRKNLDMIVANLVGGTDSAFGSDRNTVSFFFPDESALNLEPLPKDEVAEKILDVVLSRMAGT